MTAFVTAGAGFLLAVLWFDLMHDVLARGSRTRELPEDALASIAGYYRRVTTEARPMNRLIAAVMIATLAAIAVQLTTDGPPAWVSWVSLALAAASILLALARTVPSAVRLGRRVDPPRDQTRLAHGILRDHVCCFVAITSVLAIQLASG